MLKNASRKSKAAPLSSILDGVAPAPTVRCTPCSEYQSDAQPYLLVTVVKISEALVDLEVLQG